MMTVPIFYTKPIASTPTPTPVFLSNMPEEQNQVQLPLHEFMMMTTEQKIAYTFLFACQCGLYKEQFTAAMGNELCYNTKTVDSNALGAFQGQQAAFPFQYLQEDHCLAGKHSPSNESFADFSTNLHHAIMPEPTREVLNTLSKHDFFKNEIDDYKECKRQYYEEDVYEGQLDKLTQVPHGFGKVFKRDGSVYIGEFSNGTAEGRGVYVFSDGSFVSGHFIQNQLNCALGYYQTSRFKYRGGFKANLFDGDGSEQSQEYTFQGSFQNGKKVSGKLMWKDIQGFSYFYEGGFDADGNFHGKGKLVSKRGVYEGQFCHGLKEGKGYFKGMNGIKYRGEYKNGEKEGHGTIYNSDETIAYKGKLKNGLPHGAGTAYIDNKAIVTSWFQGIDMKYLPYIDEDQY